MVTRSWSIETGQALAIRELADGFQVPHSQLVRALLAYALRSVEAGRLRLEVRPCRYELVSWDDEDGKEQTEW